MVYWTFKKLVPVLCQNLTAIRNGQLVLPPLFFSSRQLGGIIDYLCTFLKFCAFLAMSVYMILVLDLCTWSTNKIRQTRLKENK